MIDLKTSAIVDDNHFVALNGFCKENSRSHRGRKKTQKDYDHKYKIRNEINSFLDSKLKNDIKVTLPNGIDKEILLKIKPPQIRESRWIDGCYYLIHTILQQSFSEKNRECKPNSYFNLSSELLQKICGKTYKIFLTVLVSNGIIECDGEYSKVKNKSFGFRLNRKYREQNVAFKTITDCVIKKNIKNYYRESNKMQKTRLHHLAHIARWQVYGKLKIDKEAALDFMESFKNEMTKQLNSTELKEEFLEEQQSFIFSRYNRGKNQIENWNDDIRFSVDSAGGRFYSQVSIMMSILRNFLKHDGDELISFDIKNSQPLHFLLCLKLAFLSNRTEYYSLYNLNEELYKFLHAEAGEAIKAFIEQYEEEEDIIYPSIMCGVIKESLTSTAFQNSDYAFHVKEGKIYEFIQEKFEGKFRTEDLIDRFSSRAKTKVEFLKLMYFDPATNSDANETFLEFKKYFPKEAELMRILKIRKHNDFSILLQKMEALVILHEICGDIYDYCSEIPLYSVHDSIITTAKYASVVKRFIQDKYKKLLGFEPKLEEETLTPLNAYYDLKKYVKTKIDNAGIRSSEVEQPTTSSTVNTSLKTVKLISEKHIDQKISFPFSAN